MCYRGNTLSNFTDFSGLIHEKTSFIRPAQYWAIFMPASSLWGDPIRITGFQTIQQIDASQYFG